MACTFHIYQCSNLRLYSNVPGYISARQQIYGWGCTEKISNCSPTLISKPWDGSSDTLFQVIRFPLIIVTMISQEAAFVIFKIHPRTPPRFRRPSHAVLSSEAWIKLYETACVDEKCSFVQKPSQLFGTHNHIYACLPF